MASRLTTTQEIEESSYRMYAQKQHQLKRNSGAMSTTTKLSVLFSFYVVYFYEHRIVNFFVIETEMNLM